MHEILQRRHQGWKEGFLRNGSIKSIREYEEPKLQEWQDKLKYRTVKPYNMLEKSFFILLWNTGSWCRQSTCSVCCWIFPTESVIWRLFPSITYRTTLFSAIPYPIMFLGFLTFCTNQNSRVSRFVSTPLHLHWKPQSKQKIHQSRCKTPKEI